MQSSPAELESDKKDIELAQLLELLPEWKPIIPDEVMDYYLQKAGFETDDIRVKRLLALAAQRFVASISADAFQYARTRTTAPSSSKGKDGTVKKVDKTKTVLTHDDLASALNEYGIGANRAPYYL